MGGFGLSAPFNEPQSDDPTSAPPEQTNPGPVQNPSLQNPLAKSLGTKKKKGRSSSMLAAAIARSKRPRQFGQRWG